MRGPPVRGGPFARLEARRLPTPEELTQRRIESSAPVFLIGLPGAGKTAVAPLLAARLGRRWDDLDALVERAAGASVPDLLAKEGEERFRAREAAALRSLLDSRAEGIVIACGGGVVVGAESRALLGAAPAVVWLRVAPETAWARLGREGAATRPLLSPGAGPESGPGSGGLERLRALHAAREPFYEALAAVVVETGDRSPEDVAAAAEAALRERWAGSAS